MLINNGDGIVVLYTSLWWYGIVLHNNCDSLWWPGTMLLYNCEKIILEQMRFNLKINKFHSQATLILNHTFTYMKRFLNIWHGPLVGLLRWKIMYKKLLERLQNYWKTRTFSLPLFLTCPPPLSICYNISVLETWNYHQTKTWPKIEKNPKTFFLLEFVIAHVLYGLTWNQT